MFARSRARTRTRTAGGANPNGVSTGIMTESSDLIVQEDGSFILQE